MLVRSLLVSTSTVVLLATAGYAQQPRITVGQNVHVSANRPLESFNESLMSAHPTDARKLIACVQTDLLAVATPADPIDSVGPLVVYTTVDGGRHWEETLRV